MSETSDEAARKERSRTWFEALRDDICAAFEAIEDEAETAGARPGRFARKAWERPGGGGGVMAIMRGRVFEKVGVNVSTVHGTFSEAFRQQIAGAAEDGRFWASGISVVAHMRSPLVPAVHMNTRHIVTSTWWFGGGTDLTPTFPEERDTAEFHGALRASLRAARHGRLPALQGVVRPLLLPPPPRRRRGASAASSTTISTRGDWEANFAFTQDVGRAFLDVYPVIVRRRMAKPWTEEQRQRQLERRGRYVEFNLLYDRGTRFGLETGGNTDAILMSLPPEVHWP